MSIAGGNKMDYKFKYKNFAEALYEALSNDAFYITMEKSVNNGSSKEAMLRYMDYSMLEAEKYGDLIIPEHHEHGASIWAKPLEKELDVVKSSEKKHFLKYGMGDASLRTYNSIVSFMAEKAAPLIGKDFWYLSIIGILPEFQGQGLGPDLVKEVLEKTDVLGVPTYLETFTTRNISFYNRIGYQVAGSFHEPTADATYWLMIRDADQNIKG